jgi:hypothetical protein
MSCHFYNIVVPNGLQFKLNYFCFVKFLKNYLLLVLSFFIKLGTHKISTIKFESHTLKFKNLKLRQSTHTSLSHKLKRECVCYFV